MSPIRESHSVYYFFQRKSFLVYTPARQIRISKKFNDAMNTNISEMWDEKAKMEALYASSEEERFKVDLLPEVIKKLQS